MKPICTVLAILAMQYCFAQNVIITRDSFTLKLPVDGENYYEQKVEATPYFVKEQTLQIYPGEKVFVEAEIKKNTISSMKVVKENLFPEKTIEIKLSQSVNDKKNEMMLLHITNPFEKTLTYEALMYIVGHDGWIRTSTMPIQPGLSGYETWSDVIITMVLDKWELK